MSHLMRAVCVAILVALAAVFSPPALAAEPVAPAQLDGVVSRHAVRDAIIEESSRALPARVQTFVDSHGHAIRVGTDIRGLDLVPYARVLAATLHGPEVAHVLTEVVPWESIETACAPRAVGCYFRSQLRLVIPDRDARGASELVHTIVHEYGHHLDFELFNLGHLDGRCAGRADGSRNWWWWRVPTHFTCDNPNWELLIAEVYAEDYTAAHGIAGWQLRTIRPPSAFDMAQIRHDFVNRFAPRTRRASAFVRRHRSVSWNFTVNHWTFLTATISGPRRSNLDLRLFRRGASRPLKASARAGSVERIRQTLRPGNYRLAVRAEGRGGRASVRLELD